MKPRRNQKDTKTKLLNAALDIFSKQGYDAATTRNIAKKAGVNESLIHRYFKSKMGLFIALKQQFRETLISEFLAYDESQTLEEEISKFFKSRLNHSRREKKFFKLAISRAILDPKSREDMQKYASLKSPALIERFERFRRKGHIRADIDLDQLIRILHSVAFSFSILTDAIEAVPREETEKLIKTTSQILARGLS